MSEFEGLLCAARRSSMDRLLVPVNLGRLRSFQSLGSSTLQSMVLLRSKTANGPRQDLPTCLGLSDAFGYSDRCRVCGS